MNTLIQATLSSKLSNQLEQVFIGHFADAILIPAIGRTLCDCYGVRIGARRYEDHHFLGQGAKKAMPQFYLAVLFHIFKAIEKQQTRQIARCA